MISQKADCSFQTRSRAMILQVQRSRCACGPLGTADPTDGQYL